MPRQGWKQLAWHWPPSGGKFKYPIPAYSEFMPPPRLGLKAYGWHDPLLFSDDDPWGWHVTEYEASLELEPGLNALAHLILLTLERLGHGEPTQGISKPKLRGNPCWPEELLKAGAPAHERYVILMPLALSRTQDDKGRVRWTIFGASEQGPSRAFWRSFFTDPEHELPAEHGVEFIRELLHRAYGEPADADPARAGFRVLSSEGDQLLPHWKQDRLPSWTKPFLWREGQSLAHVKYLLSFEPFGSLPKPVRRAYLGGELNLLPFPGSLLFWGTQSYLEMERQLPLAIQIPLLHSLDRREAPGGIRVPQSGVLHEPRADGSLPPHEHGPMRETFRRTHRWARVHRWEDELAVSTHEDKVAHVLFSEEADDLGLYGKPMARNAQLWTHDYRLLLNGPRATRAQLRRAAYEVAQGGVFGYRFLYPPMQIGRHAVYWQRPLVAFHSPGAEHPTVLHGLTGYLTAYDAQKPSPQRPIELWPRQLAREPHIIAARNFCHDHDAQYHKASNNVRKLLDAWELSGGRPLDRSFARQLIRIPKRESLDEWLDSLPARGEDAEQGRKLLDCLRSRIEPAEANPARTSSGLTFSRTAKRSFEVAYWKTIARLATGSYVNKDNADCVNDPPTREKLSHPERDLEALGDYLLKYYRQRIESAGLSGKALAGELPFQWRTDFDFTWSNGWVNNQKRVTYERDLVCVIPGRDRGRAVIMGDHYDTAYMEDVYGYGHGGGGPRLSASGADDNHCATAALMLAAPIFLDMSRRGKLACDVWLVHLTGEEFPSDCMGARHLAQCAVEGNLKLRLEKGRQRDLSKTRIQGVYVSDMIAHNNDKARDIFQICPGTGPASLWLAYQAHLANKAWNDCVPRWNQRQDRQGKGRGKRSVDPRRIPDVARHPLLDGEVRPVIDPHSVLYNTDGQIFSDAGIPVVLFMENYDINRQGYHDTHDTMENIDLDYGSGLAAIVIESVARAATQTPGDFGL